MKTGCILSFAVTSFQLWAVLLLVTPYTVHCSDWLKYLTWRDKRSYSKLMHAIFEFYLSYALEGISNSVYSSLKVVT